MQVTHFMGEGRFIAWDPETGQEEKLSPASLALKSQEVTRQVNGRTTRTYHPFKIEAISPDGKRMVVTRLDWTGPKVFDVTGQEICMLTGGNGHVISAAFSHDGKYVATATRGSRSTLKIWRADTGQECFILKGHANNTLTTVAYSPDGKRVVSGGDDGTIRLWDTKTGQETLTLKALAGVISLVFSPDGRQIASGTSLGTIQIWDATPASDKGLLWFDPPEKNGSFAPAPEPEPRPKVIEFQPGNADAWLVRARLCAVEREWAKAIDAYAKVIELKPNDYSVWRERGLIHGEQEQWAEAATDFAKSVELLPAPSSDQSLPAWPDQSLASRRAGTSVTIERTRPNFILDQLLGWRGLALAGARDVAGYRKASAELLQEHGNTQNPDLANNVAWFCVRFPEAVADVALPLQLAEKSVALKPNQYASLNTLGAALYRASRFEDSIRKFDEAIKVHGQGGTAADWLFLAMAHHRLSHANDAKKWLTKAQQWMNNPAPEKPTQGTPVFYMSPTWEQRLELKLIRAEAEGLIKDEKKK